MEEPAYQPVVLLAEDEPTVRNLVCLALTRAGYTVLPTADGAAALQLSRAYAGKIDLLLTDVKMPNMSGPDLASLITAERPEIQIVLMSGHSSGEVPPTLRRRLLRKPFLPRDLVIWIESAMRDGASPDGHRT